MVKNIAKFFILFMFAFCSVNALAADSGYSFKSANEATSEEDKLSQLENSPNGETNIVIVNFLPKETISLKAPLSATIEAGQDTWVHHPTLETPTTIKLANSNGVEIFNKDVFHRSRVTVDGIRADGSYIVNVKQIGK